MKGTELLLLNTLVFTKELALNGQESPSIALSKIIREVEQTLAVFDQHQTAEDSLVPTSGNTVELRTVGKHKWLFINGGHVARVVASSLEFSADAPPRFKVTFDVDHVSGFDH